MKNSLIDKESVAVLKSTNPADIFGNGSGVSIKEDDLCLVITTSGWSAIYRAIYSNALADDSIFIYTGVPGLLWKRQLYADNNPSALPAGRLSIRNDGVLPVGYSAISYSSSLQPLHNGTPPAAIQSAIVAIYNNHLYAISPNSGVSWKVNVGTGVKSALPTANITLTGACGCVVGDYLYIFDTNSNTSTRLNLLTETWATLATPCPGNSRTRSCAIYANGKIYLAGGCEVDAPQQYCYEYNTDTDTYVQKNDTGQAFYGAGAAKKSDTEVYLVYDYDLTGLKALIYNAITDSWDLVSIPNSVHRSTVTDNNVYYDQARNEIGVLVNSGSYTIAGLSLAEKTWSTVHSVGIGVDQISTCFDSTNDRLLHSIAIDPFAGYVNRVGKVYAVKN